MIRVIILIFTLFAVNLLFPVSIDANTFGIPSPACLGNCPTDTPFIPVVTRTQTGFTPTKDVQFNAPSPAPDVFHNNNKGKKTEKKHPVNRPPGLIQFILQLLQLIIQLIQQLLGVDLASITPSTVVPTNTTTITPSSIITPTTQPTSIQPTVTVQPTSIQPTVTVHPTSVQPSSTPSPTLTPSVTPVISLTPTPTGPNPTDIVASPDPEDGVNYAGYYFKIPNLVSGDTIGTTFDAVSANCGTNGLLAPWPGMGDTYDVESNLAQLGIDIQCTNGTLRYFAWTEALPAASVYPPNTPITQGDTIYARITYEGNGSFSTTITDLEQNWSIDTPMNYDASYVPVGAEIINEEVNNMGVMHFSPITFDNTLIVGGVDVPIASQQELTRLDFDKVTTSDMTRSTFTSTYSGP